MYLVYLFDYLIQFMICDNIIMRDYLRNWFNCMIDSFFLVYLMFIG